MRHLARVPGIGEILFVDASDDAASLAVLQTIESGGVAGVTRAEVRGRAKQMNQGARDSRGGTLVFLHCDTLPPRSMQPAIEQVLSRHDWGRFDLRLDAPGWRFRVIETMINLRSRLTRIATGDQAIFARRDFFLAAGCFADIPLMEDIEFSRRIGRRSPPGLVREPVLTSARRWIVHGTVRTILLMWKLRLLYRFGVSPERLAQQYRTAR